MACVHVVPDLGYDAMNTSFGASGMARIAAIVLGEVTGRYVIVVSMAAGGTMNGKLLHGSKRQTAANTVVLRNTKNGIWRANNEWPPTTGMTGAAGMRCGSREGGGPNSPSPNPNPKP